MSCVVAKRRKHNALGVYLFLAFSVSEQLAAIGAFPVCNIACLGTCGRLGFNSLKIMFNKNVHAAGLDLIWEYFLSPISHYCAGNTNLSKTAFAYVILYLEAQLKNLPCVCSIAKIGPYILSDKICQSSKPACRFSLKQLQLGVVVLKAKLHPRNTRVAFNAYNKFYGISGARLYRAQAQHELVSLGIRSNIPAW